MHYCAKCGTEVSDKIRFCPKCGSMQKIDIKEYDNNSNDYTRAMPQKQPVMPQEDTVIYEDSSKSNIIKLVLIGTLIGIFILAAGCGGYYYYYTKNDKVLSQQNSDKMSESTTNSNNTGSDKDDNTSNVNKEVNKTNDTNTSNKEANDNIFKDSSNVRLTDTQLNSLSKENLALARNEIYARHGYVFQTEPYKSYFGNKTWYKANSSFKGSDEEINEVERYNVQLILKYEDIK